MKIDWQIYLALPYKERLNDTSITYLGRTSNNEKKSLEIIGRPYTFASNGNQKMFEKIENLKRIEYAHPSETYQIRGKYKSTYESDIPFTRRLLLDNLESEKYISPKIIYFDIETTRNNKIISNSIFFSDKDDFIFQHGEEEEIIKDFLNIIKDYDIYTSWSDFDYNIISNKVKLPDDILYLDLLKLFKEMYKKPIQNYKLSTVAKLINNEKVNLDGKMPEDLNLSQLRYYNLTDSLILKELDLEYGIINFYTFLAYLARCEIKDILYSSSFNDVMMLREFRKRGLALQNKNREKKSDSYKGAYCFAEPGLYKDLIVLDFSSLYPSIIQNANISPETLGGNDIKIPDSNIMFSSNQKGIIPTIMEFMIGERNKLKQKYRETKEEKYNVQQVSMKMNNINALYGMFSNSYSRIYNLKLAETVTSIGRNLIQFIKSRLEESDFNVAYADTDSTFISDIKKENNNTIENLVKKFVLEFVEKNNLLSDFGFENQGNYEKMFIQTRKQYILFNSPDIYIIKGMGIIRGDTSNFQKEIDFSVMKGLLDGKKKRELNSLVNKKLKDIKNLPLNEIGFPKKVDPNKAYRVMTIAKRASIYTQKNIGDLEYNDYFKIVYIKKVPFNLPFSNVIAIPKDLTKLEGFEIDYNIMKEKSISRIKDYIIIGLDEFF